MTAACRSTCVCSVCVVRSRKSVIDTFYSDAAFAPWTHTHVTSETRARAKPLTRNMFDVDRATLSRRELLLLKRLERVHAAPAAGRAQALVQPRAARRTRASPTGPSSTTSLLERVPGAMTNVHHAYRATLAWKRKPPLAGARLGAHRRAGVRDDARPGQFALWSYTTGVLGYALGHVEAIEADMNAVSQKQKARAQGRRAPRRAPQARRAHVRAALDVRRLRRADAGRV